LSFARARPDRQNDASTARATLLLADRVAANFGRRGAADLVLNGRYP
jgi:hypothetical protein